MKIIPNIIFIYDDCEEKAEKVNKLIDEEMKKINRE